MRELIDQCLYNWIGYGNCDGDIWFIGMEEGGAEIWREGVSTKSLEESLTIRSRFSSTCDFREIWEEEYGISLDNFKKITTWHFISAFILAFQDEEINDLSIREFLFKKKNLGTIKGNHFLCDLLPLPKKSEFDFPYTDRWIDRDEYLSEVTGKRFFLIADLISKSKGASLIIVYDKNAQKLITEKWGNSFVLTEVFEFSNNGKRPQTYTLHTGIIEGKVRKFIYTPFFGNGWISYEGISKAMDAF
jgi:hypothetical protein